MRIIAFVGSPVEDNEKDVSPRGSGGFGWEVSGMGLSVLGEPGRGSGFIPLGKGGCTEFSVSTGGPWGGQQSSVCFCEVCHLPSWCRADFLMYLPFFPAGETGKTPQEGESKC